MALIVPVSYATYGDSTATEGGPLRKYILAQFRSDADLGWVGALRAELVTDELKYKLVRQARPQLRQNEELWDAYLTGVSAATLVVIDPSPMVDAVRKRYVDDGGREGSDFGNSELIQGCAAALIAGTPIAYLPNELAKIGHWLSGTPVATLQDFSPTSIQEKVGSGLRAASIFAARAHATFEVVAQDESSSTTRDVYRSPLAPVILRELISIERSFDEEDSASADLLNHASDEIASFIASQMLTSVRRPGELPPRLPLSFLPLVQEASSQDVDHIQAADVAAGLAREILEVADAQALTKQFEGVIMNGSILRRPKST